MGHHFGLDSSSPISKHLSKVKGPGRVATSFLAMERVIGLELDLDPSKSCYDLHEFFRWIFENTFEPFNSSRNGVTIFYCNLVDGPTIDAHSHRSILLGHQKCWCRTWAHGLPYVTLLKQFIHLPLQLLGLIRIVPICRSIR